MSPHSPFPQLLIWIALEDGFIAEYSLDVEGEIILVKRIFTLIWWHLMENLCDFKYQGLKKSKELVIFMFWEILKILSFFVVCLETKKPIELFSFF